VTPFSAFQLGVRWFCPALFRGVRGTLTEVPGGLHETVIIPSDRRDSIEFFWLCCGVMRQFPTIIGWETTSIAFDHSDHRADYRILLVRNRELESCERWTRSHANLDGDLEELAGLDFPGNGAMPIDLVPARAAASIVDRLRELLHEDQSWNTLSADRAASRLALSERSLSRRLAADGTTFRAVRDEVRREIATHRVLRGDGIAEVADALGFGDATAFSRAFRRWTGRSPGAYRRMTEPERLGRRSQESGVSGTGAQTR
jgi:AraC-like DNA-binding protein